MIKLRVNEQCHNFADSFGHNWEYFESNITDAINTAFLRTDSIEMNESDWSRLYYHKNNGCFMISAYRNENTEEVNKQKTDKLAKEIKSKGLGYIRILGGFIENKGTENEVEVIEESFFVPKPKNYTDEDFFKIAINFCKDYNQDSVLISLPNYTQFGYYDKQGKFDFSPGDRMIFNKEHIKEYFSELVYGRRHHIKFAFSEWIAVRHPSSVSQSVWMNKYNELNR